MEVYRIAKCKFINDLTGMGAATFGGRWNSKGTHLLYTAATPSLALLETVVHISNIPLEEYCMITLSMPEKQIVEITSKELPGNWFVNPPPDRLKTIGDEFVKANRFLVLKLPSAIMMEDFNFLINPNHPDFSKVSKISMRTVPIDDRLMKK